MMVHGKEFEVVANWSESKALLLKQFKGPQM